MKKIRNSVCAAITVLAASMTYAGTSASAQECYLGEVRMFAGNFSPRGWMPADGRLLPIAQYSAAFSLMGTIYGGDGRTTFGLPDLRGRTPVGYGQGPGLTDRRIGQKFGSETVTAPTAKIETEEGSTPVDVGGRPQNNIQPSIAIGYHVCMQGVYPSRS